MNLILIGPPGSGKGTQGEFLENYYSIKRISTGDLLREEVKKNSEIGKKIKDTLGSGKFVEDETVFSLLQKTLKSYNNGFILDGYPRNIKQASSLDALLDDIRVNIDKVLYFNIKEEVLIDRICNRFYCANCNTNYNKRYKNTKTPGVCDECGSTNLKVREDDNISVVKNRFNDYQKKTLPLIAFYQTKGILSEVDANQSIQKITEEIKNILKK